MENTPPIHELPLHFRRADFEAIFFVNGQGNLFHTKEAKQLFFFTVFGLLLAVGAAVLSLQAPEWYILLGAGLLLAILMGIKFTRQAWVIIRWRNTVNDYINRLAAVRVLQVKLAPTSLSLVKDGTEYISRWTDFNKAEIHPGHIFLQGTENHYFPRAAFSPEDYALLEKAVRIRFYESGPTDIS